MNILKLAKNLKEFTLAEISMLAECDVENELKTLLKQDLIEFENGVYRYGEKKSLEFGVFIKSENKNSNLDFENGVNIFLDNYVKVNCTQKTCRTYVSIFKMNILPFFKECDLSNIANDDIENFYKICEQRNLGSRRFKNTLALLNQLIKYFQNQGVIDKKCVFQVKRLTPKVKFSLDRLVIGKERNYYD